MAEDEQPQKSYGLFIFGCFLLLAVDFLWTFSSVLVSELLDNYFNKPAIITFCSTAIFALYIPMFYLANWLYTFYLRLRLNSLKNSALESYAEGSRYDEQNSSGSIRPNTSQYQSFSSESDSGRVTDESTSLISTTNNHHEPFNTVVKEFSESDKKQQQKDPFNHLYHFEIDALPGSDIYNNLQSQQILSNERGWPGMFLFSFFRFFFFCVVIFLE